MIERAIASCSHAELRGILAFARFAGLRIPCEIRELKFSDFDRVNNLFRVDQSGKTGQRRVPIFEELFPFLDVLQTEAKPDQVYVFEHFRNCRNIGTLIKKRMGKAGLVPWVKFFVNLRSSCITDKERLGWPKSVMNAVFGNSEAVRLGHYIQPMADEDYGKLGFSSKNVDFPSKQSGNIDYCLDESKRIPVQFPAFLMEKAIAAERNLDQKILAACEDFERYGEELTEMADAVTSYIEGISFPSTSPQEDAKRAQAFIKKMLGLSEKVQKKAGGLPPRNGRYGTRTCDP